MGKQKKPAPYRLGIDLGGTKIHAVMIDPNGRVLASARRATESEDGYKSVLKRIAVTAEEVAAAVGVKVESLPSIGLGMPGPIDDLRGVVHLAPNLGWRECPVAADLKKLLKRPVVLGNDANFGCLGEVTYGAAAGATSAFAVFVGTGLGGGLVLNGHLLNGLHGFSGEIGHITAPFSTVRCGCGLRGCLETSASKVGIIRLILQQQDHGTRSLIKLKKKDRLKSSQLRDAWKRKCPATRAAVSEACRALGWGLATVAAVIDPQVFVLGGGVIEAMGRDLMPQVKQGLKEFSMSYRDRTADIRLAALGDDAVAIGAAVAASMKGDQGE